jgi:hypothetical protein
VLAVARVLHGEQPNLGSEGKVEESGEKKEAKVVEPCPTWHCLII